MIVMDTEAVKRIVIPAVLHFVTGLGKYVIPAVVAYAGVNEAKAGEWFSATAEIVVAAGVGAACSWIDRWWHAKEAAKAGKP